MLKKTLFLLIFVLSYTLCSHGQDFPLSTKSKKAIKSFNKAMEYYQVKDAEGAEIYLLKAIGYDARFIEAWMLLGNVYEDMRNADKAMESYRKAIEIDPGLYPRILYNLARLELNFGQYQEARLHYEQFLSYPNLGKVLEKSASEGLERAMFALDAVSHPVPFDPVNMGDSVNSSNEEYFPSLTLDGQTLVITVKRPRDEYTITRHEFEEDFYVCYRGNDSLWSKSRPFGSPLNSHGNEGAQSISADGKTLFFTACERSDGYGSCDLYFAYRENNRWTQPRNLGGVVNSGSWDSQPSISPDGSTLYYASARDGGKGSYDLWKITRLDNGQWSAPENLGDVINTGNSEQTPFIHSDGRTLFFTSNGHMGMGGFDIFYSRLNDSGQWSVPVNLGYPINTYNDEGFLIVNARGDKAYFSSDRLGGFGKLDIYEFELYEEARPVATTYLKGTVYDKNTGERLQASFELIDLATSVVVAHSLSDAATGEFMVNLPTGKDYALNVSKEAYLFYSDQFMLTAENTSLKPFQKDVPLQPIEQGKTVVLKNIFFDFDKSFFKSESEIELGKLISLLIQNPGMKIEIGGHTDNVGSAAYNLKLSQDRAKSVYDYLVLHGIAPGRLSYKGYGFSVPIDTTETEEGRANNRRTEFKVISY